MSGNIGISNLGFKDRFFYYSSDPKKIEKEENFWGCSGEGVAKTANNPNEILILEGEDGEKWFENLGAAMKTRFDTDDVFKIDDQKYNELYYQESAKAIKKAKQDGVETTNLDEIQDEQE